MSLASYRDLSEFSEYIGYLNQKDSEPLYIKSHIVTAIKVLSYWAATAPDGRDEERIEWMQRLKNQVGKIIKAPRPDSQQLKDQGKLANSSNFTMLLQAGAPASDALLFRQ